LAAFAFGWNRPAGQLTCLPQALAFVTDCDSSGGRTTRYIRASLLLLLRATLRQDELLPGTVEDLQAALLLARGPTRRRALILGQPSRALLLEDRVGEMRQAVEEMLALARRLSDEECQIEALLDLAHLGTYEDRDTVAALQNLRETARRIGSGRLEMRAFTRITHALEGRGDHERAIQAGREGRARAKQLGLARYVAVPVAAYTRRGRRCWLCLAAIPGLLPARRG
jgi:hypothetical protein